MITDKNIVLERYSKKPILIDAYYSKRTTNQSIIIFCHGYKGFKDWGAWNIMANTIANAGFCFIKFNFSHNGGTLTQPIDFPDLKAFGNNNYTKELEDLNAVINWSQSYFKSNQNIKTSQIALMGHSRGGGIAILKTAEDKRITKLITLASVSDFAKRTATTGNLKAWKAQGVKYVINGRTKQQMPHYYQFYEDFKANEQRLHIASAEKKLKVKHLIIHGNKDVSVKIDEAYALHKWNPKSQLEIVDDANHVFNVTHPWSKDLLSEALTHVINTVICFLK